MLWLQSITPCELRPLEPKVWIILSYCMALLELMIKAGLYSGASCNMSRRPHHEGLPQCVQNGMPTGKFMTDELGNQVSKVFESKWV
jgi:hypothetical protein